MAKSLWSIYYKISHEALEAWVKRDAAIRQREVLHLSEESDRRVRQKRSSRSVIKACSDVKGFSVSRFAYESASHSHTPSFSLNNSDDGELSVKPPFAFEESMDSFVGFIR